MSYQAQDAPTLCSIGSAANGNFPPALPTGWTLGTQLSGASYISGIQAFLCSGALPSAPSVTVYALAIGFNRPVFLPWYSPSMQWLTPLPSSILGTTSTTNARAAEEALAPVFENAARISPLPLLDDLEPSTPGVRLLLESRLDAMQALENALDDLGKAAVTNADLDGLLGPVHRAFGPVVAEWRTLRRALQLLQRNGGAVGRLAEAYNRRSVDVPLLVRTLAAQTTGTTGTPYVDFGFLTAYQQIRSAIWSAITVASARPLYVIGHNIGAPPAQLAAIDFRSGRSNPASPVASLQAYYFGEIAVGDVNFASTSASLVPAAYAIQYDDDFVPQQPQAAYGYALTGQQILVTGSHGNDPYDSPWWQQSGELYCNLLDQHTQNLNTPTPVAVMSRGDVHFFARGAYDELRHQRCVRYLHDSRTWYAWRDLGPIAAGTNPAAAPLGNGSVAVAAQLPLGGTGVRLFDGYWHPWRVSPQSVSALAAAGGPGDEVHLAGIAENGNAVHWRVDARSGQSTTPVAIPSPSGIDLRWIGLTSARGQLFAMLRGASDEIHTATFENDVWRAGSRLAETTGTSGRDDVRIGTLVRGVPRFLAVAAGRSIVVTEAADADQTALLAAPSALAPDETVDGVESLAFAVSADLRLVESRRRNGAWSGWNELPFGRFEDPVAGVIRDHSQQRLDQVARQAGLI